MTTKMLLHSLTEQYIKVVGFQILKDLQQQQHCRKTFPNGWKQHSNTVQKTPVIARDINQC
jgi:hypothetical protein